jgi:general secretion pathway protein K
MHERNEMCRNPINRKPRSQGGVALVTALLVVSLATMAAVAMVVRQQMDIRRTANVLAYDQAMLYLKFAEDAAGELLHLAVTNSDNKDIIHMGQGWNQPVQVPVEGGVLEGVLEDMQGRFNVNSLRKSDGKIDETALKRLQNLLALRGPYEHLATAVAEWVGNDENDAADLADLAYLGREKRPYRAAVRPMESLSELRAVQGFNDLDEQDNTQTVFDAIAPYLSALPPDAGLNVNTMPDWAPQLLMMLDGKIAIDTAESLLKGERKFSSPAEFLAEVPGLPSGLEEGLTVKSRYFMLHTRVQLGHTQLEASSLLDYDSASGAARVIRRSIGTDADKQYWFPAVSEPDEADAVHNGV